MNKHYLKINGWGYKNGNFLIKKDIEIDSDTFQKLLKKDYNLMSSIVKNHLPNVDFDIKKLSPQVTSERITKDTKTNSSKSASMIGGFVAGKLSNVAKSEKSANEDEIVLSFANELTHITRISFNNNVDDITKKLDEIYLSIKSYKWKLSNDDKNKSIITENNKSLSKCLNKFEHGLKLLYKSTGDDELKKEYNKMYKKLSRKKALDKFGLVIGLTFSFFIIIFILWIIK